MAGGRWEEKDQPCQGWGMSRDRVLLTCEPRCAAPVGALGAVSAWLSTAKVGLVWEKLVRVRCFWPCFCSVAAEP